MKRYAKFLALILTIATCLVLAVFTACDNSKSDKKYALNQTTATLGVDETVQLTVTSADGGTVEAQWTSGDVNVATVSGEGLVTAVAVGSAVITATVDGEELTCSVTVVEYRYSLSKTEITLNKGEGEQLTVTSTPEKQFTVEWNSTDNSVVTVSENGYVQAVGAGQAAVTAYVDGQILSCLVTVPLVYEYALNEESIEIFETYTQQLSIVVTPAKDVSNAEWSSSDVSVATVGDDGLVTGVSAGTATVTAVADGNVLTCEVTVKELVYEYTVTPSLEVPRGQTADIVISVNPEKSFEASYVSSDETVATVGADGKVTGVKVGTATVTVTIENQPYTVNVEVTPSVTATSENTVISQSCIVNLSEENITYWEHYGSDKINTKLNAEDIVTENNIEKATNSFSDYKASMNWTNGSLTRTWIGYGNGVGRHTGTAVTVISFNVSIPAGTTVLRVYTGAWKATNVTQVYDGETLIASADSFTAGDASVNTLITFTFTSDIAKTVTVKITPENSSGNCSLVAVAVLCGNVSDATTSVSLDKVEMTGENYDVINLTERGDLDWYYLNYSEGQADRKDGGTPLIDSATFAYSAESNFWDYPAAFNWSDGTVNANTPADDNCSTGTNNGKCGDYVSFNVAVNASVKTVSLWIGGYNAEYYLEIIDAKGNVILNERMGQSASNKTLAYEVNIAVTASQSDTLTVVIYRTSGSNCSLAAVAVSANEYSETQYAISLQSAQIDAGNTLELAVSPSYGYVRWTSSDTSVAVVENGVVRGVGGGTAVISAIVRGQVLECNVTVYSYSLSATALQLKAGETHQLSVTSNPELDDFSVEWRSEDAEVAAVSAEGLVSAAGAGATTVYAVVKGVITLECSVTVTEYKYSLSQTEAYLDLNGTASVALSVNVTPDKTDLTCDWSSSDTNVVTVENGNLTAIGIGSATVTVVADGITLECAVTVTNSAVSVASEEITEQRQYNITSEIANLLDWEYYGNGSDSDYMLNSVNLIDNGGLDEAATATFNDYKLYMNWTNGTNNVAYIGNYNRNGRTIPNGLTFNVTVPAGTSKIYVFTGAWNATNLTELYLGNSLAARAEAFTAGGSSINTVIIFTIVSEEETVYTVKINCIDSHDNGNCSIVAAAVSGPSETTTSVSLQSKVEMTGYNDCHVNLTERGTIDWWYLNYEGQYYDEKQDGTAIDIASFNGSTNKFWDYKAAFSWTDGTNYPDSPIDNDCNDQGTNNGYCGGFEAVDITVDENTQCISMWVGGYDNSEYYVEVVDSKGNVIFNEHIATSGAGTTAAYEVNLSINATVTETVTVAVYMKAGNNCSLAAVAVS